MKITFKQILLCLMLMLTSSKVIATKHLVLDFKDHTFVTFGMDEHPKITFLNGKITITHGANLTKEVDISQIVRYYFSNDKPTTNIDTPNQQILKTSVDNGHVRYQGLIPAAIVRVLSLNGQQVACYTADTQGCVDINLTSLPCGMYILQAGKNIIKIAKK